MRYFDEYLSNILHTLVAIPFGLTLIAVASQLLVHAA
jgi:hypothetical protein